MILSRDLKASAIPEEMPDEGDEPEYVRQHRHRRWPFLLVLLGIAILIVWITPSQEQHFREMLVRQQVQQLRIALMLYRMQFKESPPSLKVLAEARFVERKSGKAIAFIEGVAFDRDGRMVDPLGYPYTYDPVLSTVRSTAPCCGKW